MPLTSRLSSDAKKQTIFGNFVRGLPANVDVERVVRSSRRDLIGIRPLLNRMRFWMGRAHEKLMRSAGVPVHGFL
jgi:hypothetical protein